MMKGTAENSLQKGRESGQALAEAAFVFIIVLLLIGGLVEFGWAYFHYLAMQNAAGEGAAYGMMFPSWHDASDNSDPNNIVYRVTNESKSDILDWSSADVEVEAPFLTAGNKITVTVSYTHTLITPLLSTFTNEDTLNLRAQAVQTILSPPQDS